MTISEIVVLGVPIALLVTIFIGIVNKNKRLWTTSLIFFIIITLAEIVWFMPVN